MKKAFFILILTAFVQTVSLHSKGDSVSKDSRSIKLILEKNKQSDGIINAEVFNELLTRADLPHVLMTETKKLKSL